MLLAALSTEERAATVAAVMALGADAVDVLMRVSLRASEAAGELMALSREQRAAALARAVAEIEAPVPASLELVHRDWIEAELVGEQPWMREAVAGGGALEGAARRWAQRRVLGGLVDMPAVADGPLATLAHAPIGALCRAFTAFGRGALAALLAGAAAGEIAAVAARLGEPHGGALVAEVAAIVRGNDASALRAIAKRALGGERGVSERALTRAGVRRLACAVAGAPGDATRQLAQHLPRELGLRLIAEVAEARDESPGAALDEGELALFEALLAES